MIYRGFWDVPVEDVPYKTGAATVMDCSDIKKVLSALHVSLEGKSVVDVGCGTGRMAQLCDSYLGFDVAPSMVAYAVKNHIPAVVIEGPDDLDGKTADMYLCLSVFTHIPRELRREYLTAFAKNTDEVLVDILDGGEGGGIAAWYANSDDFEADLIDAGFLLFRSFKQGSPDGAGHRYYHARKRP